MFQLEKNNNCHFPTLQSLLARNDKQCPSNIFIESLKVLDWMFTTNNLQLELIDLQSNNLYKNDFDENN